MRGTSLLNRHFERRRGSLIGHTPAALCWELHRRFSMEGVSFHFSTRQRDGATERFFIIYYETLRRLPLSAAKRKDFFRLNFFGYPLAARGHHQQIEIDCLCLFFPPLFRQRPNQISWPVTRNGKRLLRISDTRNRKQRPNDSDVNQWWRHCNSCVKISKKCLTLIKIFRETIHSSFKLI